MDDYGHNRDEIPEPTDERNKLNKHLGGQLIPAQDVSNLHTFQGSGRITLGPSNSLEGNTNVSRAIIYFSSLLTLMLSITVNFGTKFLCNFMCFIYPAFASVNEIEQRTKAAAVKWITYWIIFSSLYMCEFIIGFPLTSLSTYWLLKYLFMSFCFIPSLEGSTFMYKHLVQPFFTKHEAELDVAFKSAGEHFKTIMSHENVNSIE